MRAIAAALLVGSMASGQRAPVTSTQPWVPSGSVGQANSSAARAEETKIDPQHVYNLAELVNLAEEHNPETRVAWEAAKERASDLHVAQSDLLPALMAVAQANTTRQTVLFGDAFYRQTLGIFEPFVRLDYTVLDFGRGSRIAAARDQLLAANFAFNTVHLEIIFETSRRYYRLLNAVGQQEAAEVTLRNAQTVQKAVDARLNVGLATLPDALEARSAAAQADYELQAAIGQTDIARGDLLTILGARPLDALQVQPLSQLQIPDRVDESADAAVQRALVERPELLRRAAEEQAAEREVRDARSAYLPKLDFEGVGGEQRLFGQQYPLESVYKGPIEAWNVTVTLRWNVFDGGRREAELAKSKEAAEQAKAETARTRDDVEQQVWTAYVELRTAFRQRDAATSLLGASQSSYDAAVKSYGLGLRNVVDVVTAERTLAQALSQDVAARTAVLIQLANLSYRTGDLLKTVQARPKP
jgi:outer membrane protein